MRVSVDPAVTQRWPGFVARIVLARGLRNGPSSADSRSALETAATLACEGLPAEADAHIDAWREAYRGFGAKPQRFASSVEALRRRAIAGPGLPEINHLVDHYNAFSVRFGLPIGGEDLDHYNGDALLRLATGAEPFDTVRDGTPSIEYPEPGEVVWADDAGVTCRRWNWRQGRRTRLTAETSNAFFVLERMPPFPLALLDDAADALMALLARTAPAVSITTVRLGGG